VVLADAVHVSDHSRTLDGLQREIGGRLWLLLLSFYGVYYAAYLYLVYKILQSLPGGFCATALYSLSTHSTEWVAPAIIGMCLARNQMQHQHTDCVEYIEAMLPQASRASRMGCLTRALILHILDDATCSILSNQQVHTEIDNNVVVFG
jgi:hypothetical protein